jgi:hypothetical protein
MMDGHSIAAVWCNVQVFVTLLEGFSVATIPV